LTKYTIGIDLDNTIVRYDQLFHDLALEENLIPKHLPSTKTAVRDFLINNDQEDEWTKLQGRVYGESMSRAAPFPHALKTIHKLHSDDALNVVIISHRSRYPYLGDKVNLHSSAIQWLSKYGLGHIDVHLKESTDAKIKAIQDNRCTVFIDDLPELLLHTHFPKKTRRIWFTPNSQQTILKQYAQLESARSWLEIERLNQLSVMTKNRLQYIK